MLSSSHLIASDRFVALCITIWFSACLLTRYIYRKVLLASFILIDGYVSFSLHFFLY